MNKTELSLYIAEKLDKKKLQLQNDFFKQNSRTSTKYLMLDDLLPQHLVNSTFESFPKKSMYHFKNTFREKKYTFAKLDQLDSQLPSILTDAFQSKEVIKSISDITKIPDLEGDPSLYAGGLSRMDKSHFLNPHIDNSHDSKKLRYRRLNILFYISPGIKESDGGNFELWDQRVKKPLKIPSLFNRLVIMETTKTSWHSVDEVISNVSRCCLSNYYFSKSSPDGSSYYHVTSFLGRPNQYFRRSTGRLDNFFRQKVSSIFNISRGKHLVRKN